MSIYGCDPVLGDFVIDECPKLPGQIRAFAAIKCDVFDTWVDWTTIAEWDAAELAGTAKLFHLSSGTYTEPSEATVNGHGNSDTLLVNLGHSATLAVRGLTSANRTFMNNLNQSTVWHCALHVGEIGSADAVQLISTVPVNWVFAPVVEEGKDTLAEWKGKVNWRTIDIPLIEAAPATLYT